LLPGNHDRYQSDAGRPGASGFDAVFGDYWKAGHSVQVDVVSPSGDVPRLAVVSADLTLENEADCANPRRGFLEYLAQGRVKPGHLTALRRAHADLREQRIASLWMLHFPFRFPIGEKVRLLDGAHALNDEDGLIALADELGIRLVLCGHRHKQQIYQIGNTLVCAAGTSCAEPESSFQILEVQVDEESAVLTGGVEFYWEVETQTFASRSLLVPLEATS
jgi:hypothetical protein